VVVAVLGLLYLERFTSLLKGEEEIFLK